MATDDSAAVPAASDVTEHHTHVREGVPIEPSVLELLTQMRQVRTVKLDEAEKALVQRDRYGRRHNSAMAEVARLDREIAILLGELTAKRPSTSVAEPLAAPAPSAQPPRATSEPSASAASAPSPTGLKLWERVYLWLREVFSDRRF